MLTTDQNAPAADLAPVNASCVNDGECGCGPNCQCGDDCRCSTEANCTSN